MKKYRWLIVTLLVLVVLLLWIQMLNVLCDQDESFYGGICFINKFIPW